MPKAEATIYVLGQYLAGARPSEQLICCPKPSRPSYFGYPKSWRSASFSIGTEGTYSVPIWGSKVTLECLKSSGLIFGSSGKTSNPAPWSLPEVRASSKASSLIKPPLPRQLYSPDFDSPCCIDQDTAIFHRIELSFAKQVLCLCRHLIISSDQASLVDLQEYAEKQCPIPPTVPPN